MPSLKGLARIALAALVVALSSAALAQAWPARPVRIIVPFAPGGVTDNAARVITEPLSARLGQQVVSENRPGAGGNLGAGVVAQAEPDGYTLLLGYDGTLVINPHVYSSIPFDTLRDFAAVTKLGDATLILVAHPSAGVRTLKELIEAAKAKPFSYGTSGTGNTTHLVAELLKQRTGQSSSMFPTRAAARRSSTPSGARSRSSSPRSPARSSTCTTAGSSRSACRAPSARARCPTCPPAAEAGVPKASRRSRGSGCSRRPATPLARSSSRLHAEVMKVLAQARCCPTRAHRRRRAPRPVGSTPQEFARRIGRATSTSGSASRPLRASASTDAIGAADHRASHAPGQRHREDQLGLRRARRGRRHRRHRRGVAQRLGAAAARLRRAPRARGCRRRRRDARAGDALPAALARRPGRARAAQRARAGGAGRRGAPRSRERRQSAWRRARLRRAVVREHQPPHARSLAGRVRGQRPRCVGRRLHGGEDRAVRRRDTRQRGQRGRPRG